MIIIYLVLIVLNNIKKIIELNYSNINAISRNVTFRNAPHPLFINQCYNLEYLLSFRNWNNTKLIYIIWIIFIYNEKYIYHI